MTALEITTVANSPEGAVIEIIDGPSHDYFVRSGRIFKLGGIANHLTGQRYAWKRFTNERVILHPTINVVIADDYTDQEGRWL
jgi:hypothetical protein